MVAACIERGHSVTAYLRTPAKLEISIREKVRIEQGDAKDKDALKRAMEGASLDGDVMHSDLA